jgi:hypothetical protein
MTLSKGVNLRPATGSRPLHHEVFQPGSGIGEVKRLTRPRDRRISDNGLRVAPLPIYMRRAVKFLTRFSFGRIGVNY